MPPASSLGPSHSVLRIIHGFFLVSQGTLAVILVAIRPQERELGPGFVVPFVAIALLNLALALFWAKGKIVSEAEERLRLQPEDPGARADRTRGYILAWALAESAGLFGFVLRWLGVGWSSAAPFFVLAVIALLLCAPRRP
jgi:hypothetical protein